MMITRKVLIIDDNKDLAESIKEICSEIKIKGVTAFDGRDGAFKFQNEHFDFVISDINLPKLSGIELIKEIRVIESKKKEKSNVPIILMSGDIEKFKKEIALLENISTIEKPFNADAIKNKIEQYFNLATGEKKNPRGERRKVPAKTFLLKEGETGTEMFWVISGSFAIIKKNLNDEKSVVIGNASSGELLGEMSFLDGRPRSASVVAIEDSDVLVIPNKSFLDIIDKQPGWFKSLLKTLSGRLRDANERLGKLDI